jgi:flagellar hook-associated protein 2
MVKQLMSVEKVKVDKLLQNRQVVQWKQELFRDITSDLNTFKSTYFDVLKPESYMMSSKNYASFDVSTVSSDVTVTTSSGAVAGDYRIKIANLAEKAKVEGTTTVNIKEAAGAINFPVKINSENKNFTIDGQTVALTEKIYKNLNELASEINSKMTTVPAVGTKLSESVAAVVKDNTIRFDRKIAIDDTNKVIKVTIGAEDYKVTIDKGNYTVDQLNSAINSRLSGIKSVSGNATFPTGYKLASDDGINISVKDANNTPVAGTSVKYDGTGTVISSGAAPTFSVANPTAGAATTFNGAASNKLSVHREILAGVNDKLYIKIGTETKEIDLTNVFKANDNVTTDNLDNLSDSDFVSYLLNPARTNNLNTLIQNALPGGISTISVSKSTTGKLLFTSSDNKQVTINGNGAQMFGMGSGFNLDLSTDDKMANLINVAQPDGTFKGEVKFTVNNVTFRYDFTKDTNAVDGQETIIGAKNKSIREILSDISSKANVDLAYSQLTRTFTLQSKTTGAEQVIVNTSDVAVAGQTSKFLETLLGNDKISSSDGTLYDSSDALTANKLQGKDALAYIKEPNSDYIAVSKPTNSFTIDGVNYVLNNDPSSAAIGPGYDPNNDPTNVIPEISVKLTTNTQKSFDKIKAFVDKYNDIIDKINTKLFEKKQYDYKPLTDEQKKDMKEDDIKKWEEKAKQGLLGNDSTLSNILLSMRSAFYEPVKNSHSDAGSIGLSMADIGITTSSDISQRGKLIIDETKLKEALQNKGDKVVELFTKTSTTVPSYSPNATLTERQQRYKELGVFQRINDILQDNLRTFRDSNGKKGMLLEKAGIKGDLSEFRNLLTDDINRRDKVIKEMNNKLVDKENNYYIKFSKLESAMQKMNEQSNWLASQLGGMSR